jgi:hypothetical protein
MLVRLFGHCSRGELQFISYSLPAEKLELTAWEDHPNEIHKEIITPEIQKLRSAICNLLVIMIEHARSIVENQSVDLAYADDDLQRVSQRMGSSYECRDDEAEGSPGELWGQISWCPAQPFGNILLQ